MTILVFQLGGSAISSAETATQLEAALLAQWPTFVSYAVSFLVVGLYWVSHHTYFAFIQDVNETQLWLNLLFLFFLSFIPFAADLVGDHPDFRAGAMLYGLDLTACTGALYLNWQYAWNRGQVLVEDSDVVVMERFRVPPDSHQSHGTSASSHVSPVHKFFSPAAPATMSLLLIKARI